MAKLHEVLAVEGGLKGQADKVRTELAHTFDKKRHLFQKKVVTFVSNQEGVPPKTEEQLDLQSTVARELIWIQSIWAKALDAAYQVADANTKARADVLLPDGTVLLTDVPATALLELEKRANEVHTLVQQVPTLDPAKGFQLDASEGEGIYRARDDVRRRTEKQQRALVLYEATEHHPAQVQLISSDVPVGTIETQEWSGLITPAQKSKMLERAEELKRAVKAARSRANEQEINTAAKLGDTVLRYVFSGV